MIAAQMVVVEAIEKRPIEGRHANGRHRDFFDVVHPGAGACAVAALSSRVNCLVMDISL